MKKCFDGIAHLDFDPDLNILAALDAPPPKGERLEFHVRECDHKMINPKDSGALAAFYEGAFTSMRLVSRRGGVAGFWSKFEAVRTASRAAALSRSLSDGHDGVDGVESMAWRPSTRLVSSLRFGPRSRMLRAGGNVEKWLVEVETIMKKSLALAIDLACDEFFKIERRQWLRNWPGQTILTVNQITWVMAMEEAIENGGGPAIAAVLAQRVEELLDVVDTVRGDIPNYSEARSGGLVVMDVHNRDITEWLSKTSISTVSVDHSTGKRNSDTTGTIKVVSEFVKPNSDTTGNPRPSPAA